MLSGAALRFARAEDPPSGLVLFLLRMWVAAQAGRLHFGGYKNALIPAYAALAILFGIAVHEVSAGLEAEPSPAPLLRLLIPYICLAQFATFVFFRFPYVPKPPDVE